MTLPSLGLACTLLCAACAANVGALESSARDGGNPPGERPAPDGRATTEADTGTTTETDTGSAADGAAAADGPGPGTDVAARDRAPDRVVDHVAGDGARPGPFQQTGAVGGRLQFSDDDARAACDLGR